MPFVETNGVETYYRRRGSGPPVVFVHGAGLDHRQWDAQTDALSDEYATVAYDVRGHGRTGGSPLDDYSIGLFAEDLAALVDRLRLDSPVVVGLSLGGFIAQAYATRYPEQVRGVVLADTFGPRPLDWRERAQRLVVRAAMPAIAALGVDRVERRLVQLQELVQGEGVSGDYEQLVALREGGPRQDTREFVKVLGAIARFGRERVDLSRVRGLVLYGEHEAGFVKRQAPALAVALRDATVREIPGAGHVANIDNPVAFTNAVRAFLEVSSGTEQRRRATAI